MGWVGFATGYRAPAVASEDHPHLDHIADRAVYRFVYQVQPVEIPGVLRVVTGAVLCATSFCLSDNLMPQGGPVQVAPPIEPL